MAPTNPQPTAPWSTQLQRPCYVNAPGCRGVGRGPQHWCTGERGHTGAHLCFCGEEFARA
jgi:hypothetical protein